MPVVKRPLALLALVLALAVLGALPTATAATTTTASTSTPAPAATTADRPYSVHVPPGYSAGVPAPLLLILHGYRATGLI